MLGGWLLAGGATTAFGDGFVISEFMAANSTTLQDEDGDSSDWIEIHNEGTTTNNLGGWYLANKASNLCKWQFPATNVPPNGYLVVFASNKNRRTPGAPLHTNFKLSSDGELLALVQPDGTNIASQFAPFPPQVTDVSYGIVRQAAAVTLLNTGAVARVFVPTNDGLGLSWTGVEFNDASWLSGPTGVGYDRVTGGVNYLPFIGLNVESRMYNINLSAFVRIPFVVANPADIGGLTLRLMFEDGFVAYMNGQEIARSNAPVTLAWNTGALAPRDDRQATNYLDFDVTGSRGFLQAGTNVLAFQLLNNPISSPDLLLLPQLLGLTSGGSAQARYFPTPTPGAANNAGVITLGPIISDPTFTPSQPADSDPITVTARLRPAFTPVASATLHYRVMFGSEVSVPFLDDGAHGDGAAGDGIFGASIPASASTVGQMVRWYITALDTTGTNISRYPPYEDTNSAAYLGAVIADPALTNALPVFHWFVENTSAADTDIGTKAAVSYNNEFYDNVHVRIRGATAVWYAKKAYKFDFNSGDHFLFEPGQPRVSEINLNATYQDKAYVRTVLAWETYRQSGVPGADAFNVRVQQNGLFFSVAVLVEQIDGTFLQRRGLDPNGALYKMYNGMNSASTGVEKKTRQSENNSDLQSFVDGVNPASPNRATFLFDSLNLPEVIDYYAAGVLFQDFDRTVKNNYLYRDSDGTGLWSVFAWDKDLTFGKGALENDSLTANKDGTLPADGTGNYIGHPFFGTPERNCCGANNLMDAIFKTAATREMFLRRLRTLMDAQLQPPGTPAGQLPYELRLDALYGQLRNDAALDLAKWGAGFGQLQDLATAMNAIKTSFLAPRRVHLYQTHSIDNLGAYPQAAGIPHAQTNSPMLTFGTIDFNPASGNQTEEYVELVNSNSTAVDISGWQLQGGVTFTFTPGTVVPASNHVYVSPDVVAFRARSSGPRGGQGLFIVGNYSGQLSARGETLRLLDAGGAGVATNTYAGNPSVAQQFLRITELMYHPTALAGNTNDAEAFEYIELKNISTNVTLDLRGVRLTNGVEFSFAGSAVTNLAPGVRVLVVRSLAAFTARYGTGLSVAGQFTGALENNGERLQLLDAVGEEVLDFSYDNKWYPITDGLGFSLVVVDEFAEPDAWSSKTNWRASGVVDGSPGVTDPPPPGIAPILVNEVLSRTDVPPPTDSIELFNSTTNAVNIGGWFISDDFGTPKKFHIPTNTVIAAHGYVVFTEADFNLGGFGFAFSSLGDEAYLFSADALGNLTGYFHGFQFGAADNGVSFGRYVNSVGTEQFVAQSATTLGAANAAPKVGPVVISEIMYHPTDLGTNDNTRDEFIELQNITGGTITLFDTLYPSNTWHLRNAVDFDFPTNVALTPGGTLLVVGFDPQSDATSLAAFRTAYGLGTNVAILGPFNGHLANSDGTIELKKPDAPVLGVTPYILVEGVTYSDLAPWPMLADGFGNSLQRRMIAAFGNDPTNWFAAGSSPTTSNALADGPLHFYRFEETSPAQPAADSGVPGGINGTYTGGITLNQSTAPLLLGNAARFDGAPGSYVNLGLFHPGNSITVEAWAQLDADASVGVWHAIVARWDGSYELDFETTDHASFVFYNQAGQVGILTSPTPLARGQWHHLVGIYDGGVSQLYVDGALAASGALPGTLRNGGPSGAWPDRVLIGATRSGNAGDSYNFKGLIDEVAIYNHALPSSLVLTRYQAVMPASVLSISPTGVISWPAYPSGSVLQATESLAEPVPWHEDLSPRVTEGEQIRVNVPQDGTNRFYRVIRP